MKLFIFGAGASAGTLGLPAARDFGEELEREVRACDVIVSFNYDVVVEQLADSMGVELVQGPCARCRGRHRCVQLIKPHGSLSWIVERARDHSRVTWRADDGSPLLRPMD